MLSYSIRRPLLRLAPMLVLVATLSGQLRYDLPASGAERQLKSAASPSWLDPARFHMSHNVSFSVVSGLGLTPGFSSLSIYTNQLRYLISNNLVVSSKIHLVQPSIMRPQQLGGNPLQIYYQTAMDWRPFPNINIHLGLSNLPSPVRHNSLRRPIYRPFQGYPAVDAMDTVAPRE